MRVAVPAESTLQKASLLRLEIRKGGKILLWSQLATRKEPDGSLQAGFQIDESLAGQAFVSFVYDAAKENRGGMYAYQVRLAEYVTEKAARADHVVRNDRDLAALEQELGHVLEKLSRTRR